jgi:hypothetical protein
MSMMGLENGTTAGDEEGVLTVDVPEDDLREPIPQPQQRGPEEKADGGAARTPPQPRRPAAADALQQQLEDLKRKNERNEKLAETLAASQRRASEEIARTRQENSEVKRQAVQSTRSSIDSEIVTIDSALEEAEAAYARAFEAGQGADLAKAQRRISELTVKKADNERRKAELPSDEQLKQQEASRPRTEQEAIDQYIEQFKPRSQAWLREHPECVTDRTKNQRVIEADKLALRAGLEPESDEYFEFIDRRMGYVDGGDTGQRQQRQPEPEQQPMKRASTPMRSAAPVRGGGAGLQVQGTRRVKLTEGEIQNATDGTLQWNYDDPSGQNRFKKGDPIGVNEMARRKAAMAARYMAPNES